MRAFSTRFLSLFLVVLCLWSQSGAAAAADKQQLNQLEMKARESFAAGRYDEALQLFAKLYAETLHPVYLRNIGRCHQKQHEPQKAIDAFHDYLAKAKKVTPDERKEIDGYISEMEALRDEQARAQTPPPTVLRPPAAAAPPPAPPPSQPTASLVATPGAPAAAESSPFYTRWWFWTAVGVVALGGSAGLYLALHKSAACEPGRVCM